MYFFKHFLIFALLHTLIFSMRVAFWSNEALQSSMVVIQNDINDSFGLIVLTVVGFYFAGGVVEGGFKAFKAKGEK